MLANNSIFNEIAIKIFVLFWFLSGAISFGYRFYKGKKYNQIQEFNTKNRRRRYQLAPEILTPINNPVRFSAAMAACKSAAIIFSLGTLATFVIYCLYGWA